MLSSSSCSAAAVRSKESSRTKPRPHLSGKPQEQYSHTMFKHKSNKAANKAAAKQPVFKQDYFSNCHRTYSCIHCRAHLANHDELISKLFQGNHGRAYLFNKVLNISCKQAVQRELLTGLHAVADIYCDNCGTTLGWKYEQAFVANQKYKEGKYIIELVHMLKENDWDLTSYNARELLLEAGSDQEASSKQSSAYYSFQIGDKFIDRNKPNGRGGISNTVNCRAADKSASVQVEPVISPPPQNSQVVGFLTNGHDTSLLNHEGQQNPPKDNHDAPINSSQSSETKATAEITTPILNRLEIRIISNDVDQLGSSTEEGLQQTSENSENNPRSLSNSPKDSLCSSRSQSDVSSYVSATDSCSSSSSSNDGAP